MAMHVVEIRYHDGTPATERTREIEAFREAGVYDTAEGEVTFATPVVPEEQRTDDRIVNLGLIGGQIADAVAEGLGRGSRVVVTGGNCSHLPGVLGGIQQALGADARIGLVWFDAHGDFNTPRTTITGRLGGMPVAVSAGLCYAPWRMMAHQTVPLPTDRIVMLDVRNLDPKEEQLIRATDVTIVRRGDSLAEAVQRLAAETDVIYLHIDLDILDERLVSTHPTREPNGFDIEETVAAAETVLKTGKVPVMALVAVFAEGPGGDTTLQSASQLLRGCLERWRATPER